MVKDSPIIRARIGGRVIEAVPNTRFLSDLPTHFVNDYVHWVDLATGSIEFRPLEQVWVLSNNPWRLDFQIPFQPCSLVGIV